MHLDISDNSARLASLRHDMRQMIVPRSQYRGINEMRTHIKRQLIDQNYEWPSVYRWTPSDVASRLCNGLAQDLIRDGTVRLVSDDNPSNTAPPSSTVRASSTVKSRNQGVMHPLSMTQQTSTPGPLTKVPRGDRSDPSGLDRRVSHDHTAGDGSGATFKDPLKYSMIHYDGVLARVGPPVRRSSTRAFSHAKTQFTTAPKVSDADTRHTSHVTIPNAFTDRTSSPLEAPVSGDTVIPTLPLIERSSPRPVVASPESSDDGSSSPCSRCPMPDIEDDPENDPDYSSPRPSRFQPKRRVAKYVHPLRTLDTAKELDYEEGTIASDGSDGSDDPRNRLDPRNPGDTEASEVGKSASISTRGERRPLSSSPKDSGAKRQMTAAEPSNLSDAGDVPRMAHDFSSLDSEIVNFIACCPRMWQDDEDTTAITFPTPRSGCEIFYQPQMQVADN